MTLPEAIRLGSMLKPQSYRGFFDGVGTCALGAAADAIGRLEDTVSGRFLECAHWPLLCAWVAHPITRLRMTLWSAVTDLNDEERWTREQIAAWVETIERQQAVAAVDPHAGIAELTPVHAREKELKTLA